MYHRRTGFLSPASAPARLLASCPPGRVPWWQRQQREHAEREGDRRGRRRR